MGKGLCHLSYRICRSLSLARLTVLLAARLTAAEGQCPFDGELAYLPYELAISSDRKECQSNDMPQMTHSTHWVQLDLQF